MDWLTFIMAIVVFHSIVLAFTVVLERRSPATGLLWIGVLVLFPGVGIVFYWFLGRRKLKRVSRWRDRVHARMAGPPPNTVSLETTNRQLRKLALVAQKVTGRVPEQGNRVDFLRNAANAYPEMLRAIHSATHHVHLEMYIFRGDETGREFAAALAAAARRGVQVRVLLDGVGCVGTDLAIFRELQEAGGRVALYSPLRLRPVTQRLNFRNHRKILVVDGKVAFVGGLNIGDEYRGLDPSLGRWRDSSIRLAGPAANHVQQVFLEDWCYTTDEALGAVEFFCSGPGPGNAVVQVVPSGPDQEWGAIHQAYFRAIAGADERLYITSPYFVPDEVITHALTTSALAGVDVRIIVPRRSDLPLVSLAGRTYFPELLKAGVRIFEYEAGFIHAKTVLVDDWAAIVGSANMDIRSFELNFEINAIVYDESFAAYVEKTFLADQARCRPVTLESFRDRPVGKRFVEGIARLMSPLM